MRNTKLLIAGISAFIISWMFLSFIVYLLSDMTYKEAMTCEIALGYNIFLGWIPVVLVVDDVHNHETKK